MPYESNEPIMKIIQIMPATGWRAVYAGDDGQPFFTDIVCWALVQDGEETSVIGMNVSEDYVDFCNYPTLKSNFLGYDGPNNLRDWKQEAADHITKKG